MMPIIGLRMLTDGQRGRMQVATLEGETIVWRDVPQKQVSALPPRPAAPAREATTGEADAWRAGQAEGYARGLADSEPLRLDAMASRDAEIARLKGEAAAARRAGLEEAAALCAKAAALNGADAARWKTDYAEGRCDMAQGLDDSIRALAAADTVGVPNER